MVAVRQWAPALDVARLLRRNCVRYASRRIARYVLPGRTAGFASHIRECPDGRQPRRRELRPYRKRPFLPEAFRRTARGCPAPPGVPKSKTALDRQADPYALAPDTDRAPAPSPERPTPARRACLSRSPLKAPQRYPWCPFFHGLSTIAVTPPHSSATPSPTALWCNASGARVCQSSAP